MKGAAYAKYTFWVRPENSSPTVAHMAPERKKRTSLSPISGSFDGTAHSPYTSTGAHTSQKMRSERPMPATRARPPDTAAPRLLPQM